MTETQLSTWTKPRRDAYVASILLSHWKVMFVDQAIGRGGRPPFFPTWLGPLTMKNPLVMYDFAQAESRTGFVIRTSLPQPTGPLVFMSPPELGKAALERVGKMIMDEMLGAVGIPNPTKTKKERSAGMSKLFATMHGPPTPTRGQMGQSRVVDL